MHKVEVRWEPPYYNCVVRIIKQVLGLRRIATTGVVTLLPVVVSGPELTDVEYIALIIKANYGTQEAAGFLASEGWTLDNTRELLCVIGRDIEMPDLNLHTKIA